MKKIFEYETWHELIFSGSLLLFTYMILLMNIGSYVAEFHYQWYEKQIVNDPDLRVYAVSTSKRKSFTKDYHLDIYKKDKYFHRVDCGMSLESYCKSLLEVEEGFPIQNLKYKQGVSPSQDKVLYVVHSFELIDEKKTKKIEDFTTYNIPKKQNKIIFILCAILFSIAAHIWIIRKWFLTKEKDFTEAELMKYWIIKIGLPLSVIFAFIYFLLEF
jgi:hypothetical protein